MGGGGTAGGFQAEAPGNRGSAIAVPPWPCAGYDRGLPIRGWTGLADGGPVASFSSPNPSLPLAPPPPLLSCPLFLPAHPFTFPAVEEPGWPSGPLHADWSQVGPSQPPPVPRALSVPTPPSPPAIPVPQLPEEVSHSHGDRAGHQLSCSGSPGASLEASHWCHGSTGSGSGRPACSRLPLPIPVPTPGVLSPCP